MSRPSRAQYLGKGSRLSVDLLEELEPPDGATYTLAMPFPWVSRDTPGLWRDGQAGRKVRVLFLPAAPPGAESGRK